MVPEVGWDAALSWLRHQLDIEERMALQQRDLVNMFGFAERLISEAEAEGVPADHVSSVYREQLAERLRWHVGESRRARVAVGKSPMSDADEADGRVLARIKVDRRVLDPMEWPGSGPDHEDSYRFAVQLLAQRYVGLPKFPDILRIEGATP